MDECEPLDIDGAGGIEIPWSHETESDGRGIHSSTSRLNLSHFGRSAVLCPVCDKLCPMYTLKVTNASHKMCLR